MTAPTPWQVCGLLYALVYAAGLINELWVIPQATLAQQVLPWLDAAVPLTVASAIADALIALLLLELLAPWAPRRLRAALLLRLLFATMLALCALPLLLARHQVMRGAAATSATAWLEAMVATRADLFAWALVPFGLSLLLLGSALRSGPAPRMGAILMVAGVGYVLNTCWRHVAGEFAPDWRALLLLPAQVGELSLTGWLLLGGTRGTADPRRG